MNRYYTLLLLLFLLNSCQDQSADIKIYRLAKVPQESLLPIGEESSSFSSTWRPEHWEALNPGEFRLMLFKLKNINEKDLEISLSYLPGDSGSELSNINRWREQIALPPISEEKMQSIKLIGKNSLGTYAHFFFEGKESQDQSLAVAYQSFQQGRLFMKLKGMKNLVEQEKHNFQLFCETLKE